jgi:transcriptional regulator with XRE-family HTH domain
MGKPKRKPTPFGRLLTEVMKERGVSIRQAARLAHVNTSTLQSWRSGAIPEDYLAVKRLAEAMGTTLSYLLTGENEAMPKNPPVTEVFNMGDVLFDGYARIQIQRLIPKGKPSQENEPT